MIGLLTEDPHFKVFYIEAYFISVPNSSQDDVNDLHNRIITINLEPRIVWLWYNVFMIFM